MVGGAHPPNEAVKVKGGEAEFRKKIAVPKLSLGTSKKRSSRKEISRGRV
jgi:hypothetical protein